MGRRRCEPGSRSIRALPLHAHERVVAQSGRGLLRYPGEAIPERPDFYSPRALREHLAAYMRARNRNPAPFAWTKPAHAIIRSQRWMLERISTAMH